MNVQDRYKWRLPTIGMKGTEVLNPRRGVPQWGYDANTRLLKHNMCGPGLYVMWTGRWFVMSDNK